MDYANPQSRIINPAIVTPACRTDPFDHRHSVFLTRALFWDNIYQLIHNKSMMRKPNGTLHMSEAGAIATSPETQDRQG